MDIFVIDFLSLVCNNQKLTDVESLGSAVKPTRKGESTNQSTCFEIQTQNSKIQTNFRPDFKGNSD